MSTFILMKILESTPSRYDLGIKLLTLGAIDPVYDHLLTPLRKNNKVLDVGCGTGALTLRAAQKGANVKGIDVNPRMLEIAKKRIDDAGLAQNVSFSEMGVAELGELENESFDAVMSGLCFSELTNDELHFALRQINRLVKPGGYFLLADEVVPDKFFYRLLQWLIRLPLVIITFLITQTTTRAVKNLVPQVIKTGFQIESNKFHLFNSFIELICKKPEGKMK